MEVTVEDAVVGPDPEPLLVSVTSGFDEFFVREHASVVKALCLTLGDDELGRDAAAEGFARALQRWNQVRRYSNPTGWVYRVGLNWARSRRRKTLREISERAAIGMREPSADSSPRDPAIVDALAGLSPEHRAVVVARYWFDWSEAQIAENLGIRPGTVKSRLSRALAHLSTGLHR